MSKKVCHGPRNFKNSKGGAVRSRISMECIVQDYHCAMVSTLNCLSCRRSCHDGCRIHAALFFSFLLTILGAVVCGGAEFPSSHAGQRGHAKDNVRRDDSVARIASAISAPVLGFGPGGLPALRAGIRLRGGAPVTVRLEVRTIMPVCMKCGCAHALLHQNATISRDLQELLSKHPLILDHPVKNMPHTHLPTV